MKPVWQKYFSYLPASTSLPSRAQQGGVLDGLPPYSYSYLEPGRRLAQGRTLGQMVGLDALRLEYMENQEELIRTWYKQWSDCKHELVFIGQGINREQITADLHDCLLTEAEDWAMGATFEDNWPVE